MAGWEGITKRIAASSHVRLKANATPTNKSLSFTTCDRNMNVSIKLMMIIIHEGKVNII